MSNPKDEKVQLLEPGDIIPGDLNATLWRMCARNNWAFMPDMTGGEPFVDPRCAAACCNPGSAYKSSQNTLLNGVPRYYGGLVRLSEVKKLQGVAEPAKPEIASKTNPKKKPAR